MPKKQIEFPVSPIISVIDIDKSPILNERGSLILNDDYNVHVVMFCDKTCSTSHRFFPVYKRAGKRLEHIAKFYLVDCCDKFYETQKLAPFPLVEYPTFAVYKNNKFSKAKDWQYIYTGGFDTTSEESLTICVEKAVTNLINFITKD